jgi:hypothetical protein
VQLETAQKRNDYVSQLANGLLAVEEQGGDVQAAYQQTMRQAAQDLGVAQIPGMPPTYDRSVVLKLAAQGQTYNEGIKNQLDRTTQQLREYELGETQKRTQLQREELSVRREDLQERRAERVQTREGQQQQRIGEREEGLRREFNDLTKNYRVVADSYGRIQSAAESGPGDISMIFSYMKLLDPGSTVREGEFATAQNAGGVPERIIAQYNRLKSGERLAPETRRQFLEQADLLYQQATKDYDRTRSHYERLAQSYGGDPARVTQEMGSTAVPRKDANTPRKTGGASGAARSPHADIPVDKMTPEQMDEEEAWLLKQPGMK